MSNLNLRRRRGLRKRLWAASRHCGICGGYIYHGAFTMDHVVPFSAGGRIAGNVVPAHHRCNQEKADRLPNGCELVWLAVVNARLAA